MILPREYVCAADISCTPTPVRFSIRHRNILIVELTVVLVAIIGEKPLHPVLADSDLMVNFVTLVCWGGRLAKFVGGTA